MVIYTTHTETLIYMYSPTKARIEAGVGAKYFLQFMLPACGGMFTISQIQSILHTRFYTLFTHYTLDIANLKHTYKFQNFAGMRWDG